MKTLIISVLVTAVHWIYSEQEPEVDYWTCAIQFEQDVIDGIIPLTAVDSFPCTYDTSGASSMPQTGLRNIGTNEGGNIFLDIYPNPAHNFSYVKFSLESREKIQIALYDLQGKLIKKVFEGFKNDGEQIVRIDHAELPSGTYLVKVRLKSRDYTSKLNLVK